MRFPSVLPESVIHAGLLTVAGLLLLGGAALGYSIHRLRRELEARDGAWYDHLKHSELMARLINAFGERASRLARLELMWRIAFGLSLSALLAEAIWLNWR